MEPELLEAGNCSRRATVNLGLLMARSEVCMTQRVCHRCWCLLTPHPLLSTLTLSNTSLLMSCKAVDFQTFHWLHLLFVPSHQQVGSSWGRAAQQVVRAAISDTCLMIAMSVGGRQHSCTIYSKGTPILIKSQRVPSYLNFFIYNLSWTPTKDMFCCTMCWQGSCKMVSVGRSHTWLGVLSLHWDRYQWSLWHHKGRLSQKLDFKPTRSDKWKKPFSHSTMRQLFFLLLFFWTVQEKSTGSVFPIMCCSIMIMPWKTMEVRTKPWFNNHPEICFVAAMRRKTHIDDTFAHVIKGE